MKRKSLLLIVMVFALASLTTIHAQEKKSLIGDYLSISGWMNIQYDYESQLQNGDESLEVISNTFNVRRARLVFVVANLGGIVGVYDVEEDEYRILIRPAEYAEEIHVQELRKSV